MSPAPAPLLAGITDEAGAGLRTQLAVLATLGWQAIELRTIDGRAIADLGAGEFAAVADTLAAAEVSVVCLDSRIGNWASTIADPPEAELSELDTLLRYCRMTGARYVRIMSYPNAGLPDRRWRRAVVDRIRRLADRAERADVVLLHENCAGWAAGSADRMLDLLSSVDSPALGLLFDTGNGTAHGYSALHLLAEIVPYVAHVHVKDATGTAEHPVYTLPGQGDGRVADCLNLLRANGYRGAYSLEPHLAVQPHQPGVPAADAAELFVAAGRALTELAGVPAR
jgi:L-ribulose-5-phosphate 3-epimerase